MLSFHAPYPSESSVCQCYTVESVFLFPRLDQELKLGAVCSQDLPVNAELIMLRDVIRRNLSTKEQRAQGGRRVEQKRAIGNLLPAGFDSCLHIQSRGPDSWYPTSDFPPTRPTRAADQTAMGSARFMS